jgi:hypothetical protein
MHGALLDMSSMLGLLIGDSKEDFLSMAALEAGQSFRPLADGGFEYFPEGTSKTGYRIDPPTRDGIMRIRRGLDGLFFALILILVFANFVAEPRLRDGYQHVLFLVVGGAIGGIVMLVARRGSRRMIQDLLHGAPSVPGLSEEERRALLVRRWKEVPRERLLLTLLALMTPVMLVTVIAVDHGQATFVPYPVILGLAVLAWFAVLQLIFEILRLLWWSRALR